MTPCRHNRILIYLSLLLPALVIISGCSSVGSNGRYHPVRQYEPRENSLGFSISPPPGKNWYEKLNKNSLIYLKGKQSNNYAIYTKATEVRLDPPLSAPKGVLEYVKKTKALEVDATRYKNHRAKYYSQTTASQYCVRYECKFEDHGAANLAKNTFVVVKNNGLFCIQPDTPDVGIDIHYFEKSVSGSDNTSYRGEGEQFISSLHFRNAVKL